MICVTINQTIAPILIAEADALLFHHGETDHKPIPLPTGRISHNAAAPNASASTAGDPKRNLKRWERVFLFYKEHISISSLLNNLVFEAFSFSRVEFSLGYKGMVWVFLSTETAHPSHLSCSGHQGSQSAQVVGGSGEGKQPPHLVDSSQLHFL